VRSPLGQIRDAVECAERAAETCQRTEVVQGGDDFVLVALWQDVVDMLARADRVVTGADDLGRWRLWLSMIHLSALVGCIVGALITVTDPQRPWVLALIVVASGVVASMITKGAAMIWTEWTDRHGTSGTMAWDPDAAIAELRTRLAAIKVSLATRLSDPYLQAAQNIEWAEERLDRLAHRITADARRTAPRPPVPISLLDMPTRETDPDPEPDSGARH
jgi:hypothetical protein